MAVPQRTDVPEDGGAIVRTAPLELVAPSVLHKVGAIALARQLGGLVNADLQEYEFPKIDGELEAEGVAQLTAYEEQGVDFDTDTVKLKKLGFILSQSDEFLRSPKKFGIDTEMQKKVARAFEKGYDKNILGYANRANHTSIFDFNFRTGVTDTVTIPSSDAVGLELAVSEAIDEISDTGAEANGVLIPTDLPRAVRDARQASTGENVTDETPAVTTTTEVSSNARLFNGDRDPLYGLVRATSHNLPKLTAATTGQTVAIVGDFSSLRVLIHAELEDEISRVATVGGVSGYEVDKVFHKFRSYGQVYCTEPGAFRRIVIG